MSKQEQQENSEQTAIGNDPTGIIGQAEYVFALEEHPGWKILMAHLEAEAAQVKEKLVDVDPTDTKEIEALQRRAQRYAWFAGTVDEILETARAELNAQAHQDAEARENRAYDDEIPE